MDRSNQTDKASSQDNTTKTPKISLPRPQRTLMNSTSKNQIVTPSQGRQANYSPQQETRSTTQGKIKNPEVSRTSQKTRKLENQKEKQYIREASFPDLLQSLIRLAAGKKEITELSSEIEDRMNSILHMNAVLRKQLDEIKTEENRSTQEEDKKMEHLNAILNEKEQQLLEHHKKLEHLRKDQLTNYATISFLRKSVLEKDEKIEKLVEQQARFQQQIAEQNESIQKMEAEYQIIEELEKENIMSLEEKEAKILLLELKIKYKLTKKLLQQQKEHIEDLRKQNTSPSTIQPMVNPSNPPPQTYAQTLRKIAPRFSKSAILLKRKPSTSITMNTIKDILNRDQNISKDLPKTSCSLSRDKTTYIIRTEKEEELNALADKIQEIHSLKEITELELRSERRKKIILLGVPANCEEDYVLQLIRTTLQDNSNIHLHRTLHNKNGKTKQLVLELEEEKAQKLLQIGLIRILFNTCKIAKYLPIIRCSNCQLYGHSEQNCKHQTYCQFCAETHHSRVCKISQNTVSHRCINCKETTDEEGRQFDYTHAASSPMCRIFQENMRRRNQDINQQPSNSHR